MFEVKSEKFGRFNKLKLLNNDTYEYVSIIPEYGGNINEVVLAKNAENYSVLDGFKIDTDLSNDMLYRGANLIPFPGRVNDGRYTFEGKDYQLPLNWGKHAIHGFLFNQSLKIVNEEIADDHVSVELEYLHGGTNIGYPFKFKTQLVYSLTNKSGFTLRTIITNLNNTAIPVGHGWHPYFKPFGKVDDLQITLPSRQRIEFDNEGIPTGKIIIEKSSSFRIGKKPLSKGYVLPPEEGKAVTKISIPKINLTMGLWQETGKIKYNYMYAYMPDSRDSISIEPYSCIPDAFNNKIGLVILQPGQCFDASSGIFVI